MQPFLNFLIDIKDAKFGFDVIGKAIADMYNAIVANPTIQMIWNGMMNLLGEYFVIACIVLAVFCVVVAFLGKKMMGFLNFVATFVVAFALGTHLLAPLIPAEINIPAWVVGLVVAIIAAVLSRFIYYVVYAVACGYSLYILCFHGFYIPSFELFTKGNPIISAIVAVVIVVLAFVFKQYIEMAITAAAGGWCAAALIGGFVYNFAAWPIFGGVWWIAYLVMGGIVALVGFIVQVATRSRY